MSSDAGVDLLPKKLRKDKGALFGEDVHTVIKGWYLSSVPVFLDDPASEKTVREVITEEIHCATRRKEPATKALLVISKSYLTIVARDKNSVLLKIEPHLLEEYEVDTGTTPTTFAFSFHSTRLGIDYVNVFQVKPKYADKVEPSLEQMKHAEKKHRQSQIDASALGIKPRVIGTRPGLLLGTLAVARKNGADVCRTAADKLKRRCKRSVGRLLPVSVVVTAEGVQYGEMLVEETLADVLIKNISFVTVLDEGQAEELFTFVEADDRLDHILCHVILCPRGAADTLCDMLSTARERSHQDDEHHAGGPFAPDVATPDIDLGILKDKTISRDALTAVKVIGKGQFGRVWLANLSRPADNTAGEEDVQVAVKMLRTEATDQNTDLFLKECQVMGGLDHPNILRLVGISAAARPWLAVLDIMNYGDLHKVLKTCKQKELNLTLLEQFTLIEQAAAGMVYIASKGIVHMDVAARNMLLHTDNSVKISDFGVAQHVDPTNGKYRLRNALKLPVRWMAPETLRGKPIYFSEQTDVYSFSVFMWEVFTYGTMPFRHLKSRAARDGIIAGLILAPPDTCPNDTYDLMLQSWDKVPDRRPAFADVHSYLRNVRLEREQIDPTPRDVGASLNALLTQNFRKLSKRASLVRRSSRKSLTATRQRRPQGSISLATMAEEPEDEQRASSPKLQASFDDDDDWSGTIKRKKSLRQRHSSLNLMTSAGSAKEETLPVSVEGKAHELVRRESVEMDLNLFDDGSKFTEFGDSGKL